MGERLGLGLVCTLLVVCGALAWWLQLRAPLSLDVLALAALPETADRWTSRPVEMDQDVADVLDADLNIQRTYFHPTGEFFWVYVGYYSTARGGRPEHTPRGCYTGAGWEVAESRVIVFDPAAGLRAQEFLVTRGSLRRLVHFWYRSHRGSGMTGGADQNIDRLLGRMTTGRADGALVRVSTSLGSEMDLSAVRSRLIAFDRILDAQLARHWPVESASADEAQPEGNSPPAPALGAVLVPRRTPDPWFFPGLSGIRSHLMSMRGYKLLSTGAHSPRPNSWSGPHLDYHPAGSKAD